MNVSPMTLPEQVITLALCVLATVLMRALPFAVFREGRETPGFVRYIGKYLPSAVFGMLIIYCLRNVDILTGTHGLPELAGILVTAGVHLWKRQMFLSIAAGTVFYILLIHFPG